MKRDRARDYGNTVPHLLLVGGGHAHVRGLQSLAEEAWPRLAVTLVSPDATPLYSGMVPGYLQGLYRPEEISLDLPELCRAAGARFLEARVERIETAGEVAKTDAGAVPFTCASVDIGSVPQGSGLPGVEENALTLRPMGAAVELRRRVDALAGREETVRIAVVGSGAGGVEVAWPSTGACGTWGASHPCSCSIAVRRSCLDTRRGRGG